MARAQAKGVWACLITFVVGSTLAVGLQMSWIMWGSLILSPFVFQFAAGKAWRGLRPMAMLEYLGARAAARRYAFTAHSKDLSLNFVFRAVMEEQFDESDEDRELKELEQVIQNNRQIEVWVALFTDAIVLMSEQAGGAKCEFAHLLNDKVEFEGVSSDEGEYSKHREVYINWTDKRLGTSSRIKLTSNYPACLVVFEKRALHLKKLFNVQQNLLDIESLVPPEVHEAADFQL